MKLKIVLLTMTLLMLSSVALAQRVIQLPIDPATATPTSTNKEKEYYSDIWRTKVVTNVTQPSLIMYAPDKPDANKTSIVICPGGGFHALSIDSEGIDVAKWLNTKGITAFVLKYRVVPTGEDGVKEFGERIKNRDEAAFESQMKTYRLQGISDGKEAIKYVRQHASDLGVSPNRIGIIGFSAGGHIAAATSLEYTAESRPDFVAPVYLYMGALKDLPVPNDAPPMFITAASNDSLRLAPDSINIYNKWLLAGKPVELHMYSKGGHGFGMRKLNLPSDTWIQRFYDWLGLFANGQ